MSEKVLQAAADRHRRDENRRAVAFRLGRSEIRLEKASGKKDGLISEHLYPAERDRLRNARLVGACSRARTFATSGDASFTIAAGPLTKNGSTLHRIVRSRIKDRIAGIENGREAGTRRTDKRSSDIAIRPFEIEAIVESWRWPRPRSSKQSAKIRYRNPERDIPLDQRLLPQPGLGVDPCHAK